MSNFEDLFKDFDDELTNISSSQDVIIEPVDKKNAGPASEDSSEIFFDEDSSDETEIASPSDETSDIIMEDAEDFEEYPEEDAQGDSFLIEDDPEPTAEPVVEEVPENEDSISDSFLEEDASEEIATDSDSDDEPDLVETENVENFVEPEVIETDEGDEDEDEDEDLDSFLQKSEEPSEADINEPEEDIDEGLKEILSNMEEFGYTEEDVSVFSGIELSRLHQILTDLSVADDKELFSIRKSLGLEKEKFTPRKEDPKKNTADDDQDTEDSTVKDDVKPSILSEKLKFLRERVGMSLDDVAEDSGVSEEDILAYETGEKEPDNYDLKMLAGAYGVTLSEILEDKEFTSHPKEKELEDISELEDYQEMEEEKEDNAPVEEYEDQTSDNEPEIEETDNDAKLPVIVPEVKISRKKEKEQIEDIEDDKDDDEELSDDDDDKPRKSSGFEKVLIVIVCLCMIAFAAFGAALVYYGVSNGKFSQTEQSAETTETETEALPENFQ